MYTLHGTLKGHRGAVLCLSATDDGKLASGGIDGVRIWSLATLTELSRPVGAGGRGATTALTWVRRQDDTDDALIYGTQIGFLVCWKREETRNQPENFEERNCAQVANAAEITGIAFTNSSNRLAVCNRNSVIQVFSIDALMKFHTIFSVIIADYLPKSVAFESSANILVFGLHDGQIHTLREADGKVVHTINTGSMIGDATIDLKHGVFCIDDPHEGVALYQLHSSTRLLTCKVPVTKSMRARKISFAEDCKVIIGGSDHGIVYVFDRQSGKVVDKLMTDTDDWVQTVTATKAKEIPFILAARSQDVAGENGIYIWAKNSNTRLNFGEADGKQWQEWQEAFKHTLNRLRTVLEVIALIILIAFILFRTVRASSTN